MRRIRRERRAKGRAKRRDARVKIKTTFGRDILHSFTHSRVVDRTPPPTPRHVLARVAIVAHLVVRRPLSASFLPARFFAPSRSSAAVWARFPASLDRRGGLDSAGGCFSTTTH
jgi:hypothetical protein